VREIVQALARAVRPPPGGDSTALCALGFALHLYGDAFSHRRLDDPRVMYPPGRGHAGDLHRPDYILYEPTAGSHLRAGAWRDHLLAAGALLGGFPLDAALVRQKTPEVMRLPSSAPAPSVWNTYREGDIRGILARGLPLPALTPPPEQKPSGRCQAYVDGVFRDRHFGALPAPRCAEVWRLFRSVAEPALARTAGARDGTVRVDYLDPAFTP
jgi:hypothetical protein